MVDVENVSDLYWERLSNSTNPGPVLARFMGEILGRTVDKSHVIMMNKFIKNYGRFEVFFAILDLSDIRDLGSNLYPILSAICKRRFERKHVNSTSMQYDKLDRDVTNMEKRIEQLKRKRLKPPSSDDLEKNKNGK